MLKEVHMPSQVSKLWSIQVPGSIRGVGANRRVRSCFVLLASIALASSANADLAFVTVGAAGNRATLPEEVPWEPQRTVGAVGYEFRITRTEVTTSQWVEFAQAYAPFYAGQLNASAIAGTFMSWNSSQQRYVYSPLASNWAIDPSWENAARMCNWLHNGRVNEAWAFESGAYDTSTFTINADGSANHQMSRSPGAQFWIPSYDELVKAIFYDPDRYGQGQEGYWLYPNRSDSPPISGLPQNGGTTNAGLFLPYADVGMYPNAASAWGVLDGSGSETEMTETVFDPFYRSRIRLGSSNATSSGFIEFVDRLDWVQLTVLPTEQWGFRVAGVVPSPSVVCLVGIVLLVRTRRR